MKGNQVFSIFMLKPDAIPFPINKLLKYIFFFKSNLPELSLKQFGKLSEGHWIVAEGARANHDVTVSV